MLGAEKEAKLQMLFAAMPEAALRQLHQAFVIGAQADPEAMPYDQLLSMVQSAADERDLVLVPEKEADNQVVEEAAAAYEPSDEAPVELEIEEEAEEVAVEAEQVEEEEPVELEAEEAPYEELVEPTFIVPRNAMHAFFASFESLIIDRPKYLSRIDGYICSTSLPAIWRLLNEEESGQVIRDAWVTAELQSEEQPPEFYEEISSKMHEAARTVFDDIAAQSRENPAYRRTLISRLGGSHILGDFLELQNLLPVAEEMRTAFAAIAPRLRRYYDEDIEEMASTILASARQSPALPGYLQLAAVATLDEPATALRLYKQIRATAKEQNVKSSDTSLIADHLIAVLDAQALWLERKITASGLEEMLLDALGGFAHLLRDLKKEVAEIDDALLEQRLMSADKKGAQLFAYTLKQCLAALQEVLPYDTVSGSEGMIPDTSWIDREAGGQQHIEDAELAAGFICSAFETGQTFGKLVLLKKARKRAAEEVRGYAEQLVTYIAENSGEGRLKALRLSTHVFRLCEMLLDKEEADGYRQAADKAARAA